MKTFKGVKELSQYVNSSQGQQAVFKATEQLLKNEVRKLQDCIQRHINAYYASYDPTVYDRTEGLKTSTVMEDVVVMLDGMSITISFGDGARGTSMFGGGTVNKAELINYGWEVKKPVWFKDKERFGHYEGYDFIGKGINDYMKIKAPQISGKLIHRGEIERTF